VDALRPPPDARGVAARHRSRPGGTQEEKTVVIAGIIATIAVLVVIASYVYLHVAATGLSPLRNAFSQYALTPYRIGYRTATIGLAVTAVALAVGIGIAVPAASQVVIALVVCAFGRAFVGWVPMDAPDTPATTTGRIHWYLGIVSFAAGTYAASALSGVLADAGSRWHDLAGTSQVLATIMFVCAVGLLLSRVAPRLASVFGAVERGFYAAFTGWLGLFSVACLR
jgi:hypothetical protein